MKQTARLMTVSSALMGMALMTLGSALPVSAGDGHVGRKGLSSAATAHNGQIVFRRYFDADQSKGALFLTDPDGSHTRQLTHPPAGWKDNVPAWSPDGKRIIFERF